MQFKRPELNAKKRPPRDGGLLGNGAQTAGNASTNGGVGVDGCV